MIWAVKYLLRNYLDPWDLTAQCLSPTRNWDQSELNHDMLIRRILMNLLALWSPYTLPLWPESGIPSGFI